jgi:hypothetical protein
VESVLLYKKRTVKLSAEAKTTLNGRQNRRLRCDVVEDAETLGIYSRKLEPNRG